MAQADWGGDHGVAVLPSGPPSRLQTLHVGAAGQQPAPLLTGRLHPDSAGYAAPGAAHMSRAQCLCVYMA